MSSTIAGRSSREDVKMSEKIASDARTLPHGRSPGQVVAAIRRQRSSVPGDFSGALGVPDPYPGGRLADVVVSPFPA